MKKISLIFLLSILFLSFYSARAQCCCSGVKFTLTDKKGKQLEQSKVKIKEVPERSDSQIRVFFGDGETYKGDIVYKLGCGRGDEILSIIYKNSEMKIHFKFYGDFGWANGKIMFQKGDFITEPEKSDNFGVSKGIKIRVATDEELNK